MSDETTGMTTTTDAPPPTTVEELVAGVEASAPSDPLPSNGAAPALATDTSANGIAEPDEEQMPPLDEIDVPGGEPEPRRGGRGNRESSSSELRPGQVVTGTVVHIDHEGVLVDVGMKTEGLIKPNELSREPVANMEDVVKVGEKIEVLVLDPESREGHPLLSKKRADFEKAWERVQESLSNGQILQAMVQDRVKGGLVVDLGIRGFVPASHVGNGKLKNLDKFVGQSIPLKVLEVDRQNRKVVLSHRLATEEERQKEKETTISSLGEGQIRTGTIRRVTDYGAFVDLGGIDGLLHVSEMSWTRVKHPSDVVKVGDQVQVMILKLNLDQGRVSLGMRQILPDPWETVGERFHVGDVIEGEVTRLVPFGAFVLLDGGIEGIIPNSELAWRRVSKPADVVDTGQQVQIKVIDVRAEERRLTLSLRQLQPREEEPRGVGRGPVAPAGPEDPAAAGVGPRRPEKRERRRDRDDDEGFRGGFTGGRDSGGGFTIGDMFPELVSASRGGKSGKGRERRRRVEEDDDDLSDLEIDDIADTADVETEAEGVVDAEATTVDAEASALDAEASTADAETANADQTEN